MSRNNYFSRHRSRERSRSFSAYRHKQQHFRTSSPPGIQPKHRNRSISPSRNDDKFRYSRTPERNGGGGRNGHGNGGQSPSRSRAPEPSKVIGVFGLHVRTPEEEVRDIFERYGPIDKITMIHDVKTRSFRGYCFIYYTNIRDATEAMHSTNGMEVRDKRIRVDYSYTQRAHTPTPGHYRGHRGSNRSFDQHRPAHSNNFRQRFRSRSRDDRSHRESFRHRSKDRERRRSPERSRYRSPLRERRRDRS